MSESKNSKQTADASKKANAAVKNKKSDLKTADTKKAEVKKVDVKKAKQGASNPFDFVLWTVSLALLVLAIGGNYYYTRFMMIDETSLVRLGRVALVIAIIVAGLAVTLFTSKGKRLLAFTRDSYIELRKVVWPTRNEGLQTTFIVFIAVSLVSLFLYLCDLFFLQIVRIITL